MAYTPTLAAIDEIETRSSLSRYKPSLGDIEELESPKRTTLYDILFKGSSIPSAEENRTQLSNLGRGALAGLLKTGQGLGELQAKGLRASGVPINPLQQTRASDEATGMNKLFPQSVSGTPEGKVGEFFGKTAPFLVAPATETIKVGQKVIPWLGKHVLKQAGILGATSPIYQPDVSIGEAEKNTFTDPLAYLALGASPAMAGLGKLWSGGKRLWNTKGGTATPEEVMRRMAAAGETPLPLGEAIGSPMVKGFQSSVLSHTPGSGMGKAYMQAGESLKNRTDKVLAQLNKKPMSDFYENVGETLQKGRLSARAENQILHDDFSDFADSREAKVNLKDYLSDAKAKLQEIEENEKQNPELKSINSKSKSGIKDLLENISKGTKLGKSEIEEIGNRPLKAEDFKNAKVVNGKLVIPKLQKIEEGGEKRIPLSPKTFKGASLLRAALNEAIDAADKEGNSYNISILHSLKNSLENDIESSAKMSGSPEIYNKYLEAKKHYQENVVPFEEGEVGKFASPTSKADTDTILQTFIRTGKTERPKLLQKLTRHLDEDSISQLAHEYLSQRGRGDLDKTLTAYSTLGEKVKNILFKPTEKEELDNIVSTRKLFNQDINQMLSAKSGEKAAKAMGFGGLGAALIGLMSGHPVPLAGLGAAAGGANLLKRALMSDKLKEQYIKAAIAKQKQAKLSMLPLKAYLSYDVANQPTQTSER